MAPRQECPQPPQFRASVVVFVQVVLPPAPPLPPPPLPPVPPWELVPPVPTAPLPAVPPVPGVPPVAGVPPVPVDGAPPDPPCAPNPPPPAECPPVPLPPVPAWELVPPVPGVPAVPVNEAPPTPPPTPPRPPVAPTAPVAPAPPSVPELPPVPPSKGVVRVGQARDVNVRNRNGTRGTTRRFVMARRLSLDRFTSCVNCSTNAKNLAGASDARAARRASSPDVSPAKTWVRANGPRAQPGSLDEVHVVDPDVRHEGRACVRGRCSSGPAS